MHNPYNLGMDSLSDTNNNSKQLDRDTHYVHDNQSDSAKHAACIDCDTSDSHDKHHDDLAQYLASLDRDDNYRVDKVYKDGSYETTQRVYFKGADGSEMGPFVRKRISIEHGLGSAYQAIFDAQKRGIYLAQIPRIIDCFRKDSDLMVVMEHVGGNTLLDCVNQLENSQNRLDFTMRVFPDICDAVMELHERMNPPVIHRDLTPQNIMVLESGIALIDLGVSRVYKQDSEQDTVHFGTRAYAPPEQFGFGQTDVKSDLYALGMLLFFCLTGRNPVASDRDLGFINSDVPENFRLIIRQATELDPSRRYDSVRLFKAAVVEAISEIISGSAIISGSTTINSDASETVGSSEVTSKPTKGQKQQQHKQPKFPIWLGLIWDVFVLFVFAILVATCIAGAMDPAAINPSYPAWYVVYTWLGALLPIFAVAAYLLLDRRLLRRKIPSMAKLSIKRETGLGVLLIFVLVLLWIVVTIIVQPG